MLSTNGASICTALKDGKLQKGFGNCPGSANGSKVMGLIADYGRGFQLPTTFSEGLNV